MDARELLLYVQKRRIYIEKNTTNDVFCASCLQATRQGEKSDCCGKAVITKEAALQRIPEIIAKIKEML